MRPSDIVSALALLASGIGAGLLLGGTIAIVVSTVVGAILAAAAVVLGVRPLVAISVGIAGVAGLFVGTAVVRVLCLPDTCTGLEAAGGAFTASGAIVGVGIVVALATRSFDEYHEAVEAGRPPPEPGCETDQDGHV